MAITNLRRLQIGAEETAGTAVPATTIWRGPAATITNPVERVQIEEHVGRLVNADRSYLPRLVGEYPMPEHEASFEQIGYILQAGVAKATGTTDGGTSDGIVWAHNYPLATTDALIQTYTLEGGNDQQAYEFAYGHVPEFTLTGASGEPLRISALWRGRAREKTTFTTSLALPEVETIYFNMGKLYLDATTDTIGTTQKTLTWLGVTLNVDTGWRGVETGDGRLDFSFMKCVGATITGNLILEYNSIAVAVEDAFAAGTTQQMRMDFIGSALGGSGGTYTTKLFRSDLAVVWNGPIDVLDSQDGNDVISVPFTARFNGTADLFAEHVLVNKLATLP